MTAIEDKDDRNRGRPCPTNYKELQRTIKEPLEEKRKGKTRMAKVITSGEVDEVKETKTGKIIVRIIENYTSQMGEQWVRKWSLWMDPNTLAGDYAKDDWLEVEGELSTKVVEWTHPTTGAVKQIIDHNLNSVRVVQHKAAQTYTPAFNDDEDDRRKYGTGLAPF